MIATPDERDNKLATAVSTIALLRRRNGMSTSLFTKYWRDVHGVMAVRIPGFETYIQYHLNACPNAEAPKIPSCSTRISAFDRLDGIAEVLFRSEEDRAGLTTSPVAAQIPDDERYVFSLVQLYNMSGDGSRTVFEKPGRPFSHTEKLANVRTVFLILTRRPGDTVEAFAQAVDATLMPALATLPGLVKSRRHAIASGVLGWTWWTPDVRNPARTHAGHDMVIELGFSTGAPVLPTVSRALEKTGKHLAMISRLHLYEAREAYVMVENSRPTQLGLRGLDILTTIEKAGAEKQKTEEVLRCTYGDIVGSSAG